MKYIALGTIYLPYSKESLHWGLCPHENYIFEEKDDRAAKELFGSWDKPNPDYPQPKLYKLTKVK